MSRVKTGVSSKRRKKRVMKLAEGYRGARRKRYRTATEAVQTALNYAYRDRRVRKREFRSLWIARINAACRINDISYSRFILGLKKADLALNRKILAELAVSQPEKFSQITKIAREYLQ